MRGKPQFASWIEDPDPPDYWEEDDFDEMRASLRAWYGKGHHRDAWDESKHPRVPAGSEHGGEFGSGGASTPGPEEARVNNLKKQAEAVSKTLGFPFERIDFVEGTREFEVNGVKHTAAGDADIYTKSGEGRIRLYQDHINGAVALAGVTAHEIEHFKVQDALNAYHEDSEKMSKDPGPPPDPNHPYWWGKKGGTDAMMKTDGALRPPYDTKYPYYTAMHEAYFKHPTSEFAEGDGVSQYSAEYWKGWHGGKISTDIALHETLAEMAKTKFVEGKFPEHFGYSPRIMDRNQTRPVPEGETYVPKQPNKAQGTRMWRELFRTVERVYKERNK